MNTLNFQPLPGLASSHLQTILASYFPSGEAPPSTKRLIKLVDGDSMSCLVSTPPQWTKDDDTIVLVHGMGGCDSSTYMVRMARKFYQRGYRVVRANLRGTSQEERLAKRPYNGGSSYDVLELIHALKNETPRSDITAIGFSLGGNIVLKLAGELGANANGLVKRFVAVCAPVNLAQSINVIQQRRNWLYHAYYLKKITEQAQEWLPRQVESLYEFDELVTAPLWGYKSAQDYYEQCSSLRFLPEIACPTHLIFAEDDPFVPIEGIEAIALPREVGVWKTKQGGHMGFLGKASNANSPFWLDHVLLNWMKDDFSSDRLAAEGAI